MPETPSQMLARVHGMAQGNPTWDLSPNDVAALNYLLDKLVETDRRMLEAEGLVQKLRAQLQGLSTANRN